MTTYYVDFVNGLDANNGLGPDASDASNKPWKTLGKLLGAAGFASGDTAYLSPAGPFRETVTVAMTSAVAETKIIGDVANAQGFKTSGGVRVTAGEVIHTAYTTNDTTAPAAATLLAINTRDHLTFQSITFVAGDSTTITGGTDATDITFTDCTIITRIGASSTGVTATASFGTALNWLFDRCRILSANLSNVLVFTATTAAAGADYDINVTIRNCFIFTVSTAIQVANSGTAASKGNGVHVVNCTLYSGSGGCLLSNSANLSNTVANTVYNSLLLGGAGLVANAAGGLITENYNRNATVTPRANVTVGANSVEGSTHAMLLSLGQEAVVGSHPRPWLMPLSGSPLLGFGGNSPPAVDALSIPRPSGGASANTSVGAYERNDTFGKETGTVRTGSTAVSITGPGTQDFELPVDAVVTTCTIYVRWDATYAGTKPQWKVLGGTECGVSGATALAVGSSGSWEQLSLSFTPARAGIVTLRLQSNDTNGGGHMYADDFAVA